MRDLYFSNDAEDLRAGSKTLARNGIPASLAYLTYSTRAFNTPIKEVFPHRKLVNAIAYVANTAG